MPGTEEPDQHGTLVAGPDAGRGAGGRVAVDLAIGQRHHAEHRAAAPGLAHRAGLLHRIGQEPPGGESGVAQLMVAGEGGGTRLRANAVRRHDEVGIQITGRGADHRRTIPVARRHGGDRNGQPKRPVGNTAEQHVDQRRAGEQDDRVAESGCDRRPRAAGDPASVRAADAQFLVRGPSTNRLASADGVERAQAVGSDRYPRADLSERRGPLADRDIPPGPVQACCCCQAADPGSDDDCARCHAGNLPDSRPPDLG